MTNEEPRRQYDHREKKGMDMTGPVWFEVDTKTCDRVHALHNQRIAVRAVLPNGWVIEGIGDIWTRVSGGRDKAAVTIVFECAAEPYVITQTRIHLSKERYESIRKTTREGTDCEFPGDLKPPTGHLGSKGIGTRTRGRTVPLPRGGATSG